jgi:hypothetical protein
MTFPTIFANLTPPTQPAALLDTMYDIVGAQGIIPCVASGTNTITVTPETNYYQPASYANYQCISFAAVNSATGAVTIQLGALGFVNLYTASGSQANSGDIVATKFYVAAYNGALNSGSGGFQLFNATTPTVVQPIQGTFKNLKIVTNDTQVTVTCDQIMLQTTGGGSAPVKTVSVVISTGTLGANGLDAGTIATATLYAVYIIYNGTTTAGLISLSGTTPTLPTGYIYFARVGWVQTGLSPSTNLQRTLQYDKDVQFVITPTSQTTVLPSLATAPGTGWTAQSLTAFIPSTASRGKFVVSAEMVAGSTTGLAQNNNYTVGVGTAPGPPFFFAPTGSNIQISQTVDIVLESTNIYSAGSGTITVYNLAILGWVDNL